MKIKSLWISEYKNVRNVNLNFDTDLTTLLVGKNGLGKSNLIEALAIIFSELDSFENEASILGYTAKYFNFHIKYICCKRLIDINLTDGNMIVKIGEDLTDPTKVTVIPFSEFKKQKRATILPKYIIGYYSGENRRLMSIINHHEQNQLSALRRWHRVGMGIDSDSLRRIFFAENHHGQILLLTLALYRNHPVFGNYVNKLFQKYLGIERLMDFDIRFKSPNWRSDNIDGINKSAEFLIANVNDEIEYPFWNLKGKVDLLLTRLYNYLFDQGIEPIMYDEDKKEFIQFSQISIDSFSSELYKYFPHPIDFFNALESTNVVEILDEIRVHVKKTDIEFPVIYTELSEGEQQLITVLGLILVVGTEDVLFLLDEPDTHLNPNWQREYIRLLSDFNLNDDNSHIFVATHSPLIVQAVEGKYDILLYHQNTDGSVVIDNDRKIIENWRIDQVLASKYFGIENTRPLNTDDYLELKQQIIRKGELTKSDIEELKKLEDGLGYLPLGETITEIESLAFLNYLSKKDDLH